jgi:lipopolysaccharide transport system permease protein
MAIRPDVLVIEAGRARQRYWGDLWRYRELLYFLAWRDISVRYKQTVLGITWAVLRPLVVMVVFTIVFGRIAKLPSVGVPYSVLVFTGMVPWFFFAGALLDSSMSLMKNANVMTKIYFPRLLIPMSAVVVALVDFLIGLALLLLYMFWLGITPTYRTIAIPAFVLLALCIAFGLGLWFAAMTVKYRDFQFVVPFVVQFGLYVSPIGFASNVIPEAWRWLFALNPMVAVIEGFRWALLGGAFALKTDAIVASLAASVALVYGGLRYFQRAEREYADLI